MIAMSVAETSSSGMWVYLFYNFQISTVTASGNELSLKISKPYRGYYGVQNTANFVCKLQAQS